jgi:uncharacterized membrane protein
VKGAKVSEQDEASSRSGYGLDRTLAISDGVFAFAITLLVLDLFVPTLAPGASSIDLWRALTTEYQSFLSYILSFIIAAIWWSAHHRTFERIRNSNATLRWLNIIFLLWIALLPFFTKILNQYSTITLGVVLYAADQAGAGFCLMLIWLYASDKHRLIDKNMNERTIRFARYRNATAPVFFVVSMGIAVINPIAASFSWYGLLPLFAFVNYLEHRGEKRKTEKKPLPKAT